MSEPISLPTERATGHELNRAVLADRRFSARYETMHNPFGDGSMGPAPVCDLTGIDPAEHTRLRRLLTGRFTHRRMRLLADRVEEFAQTHLDAMQRHGPPVDLAAAYGQPIPALMICELRRSVRRPQDVPAEHRDRDEPGRRHGGAARRPGVGPSRS